MSRNLAHWPALFVALFALACAQGAAARSSDRNQVMTVAADRTSGSLDDRTPTVLSGNVIIEQGTLQIKAAKAVLNASGGEVSSAIFIGSPARLTQQLNDGTPVSATANKIDYNLRTEVVVLTGDVHIKQPRESLRGDRVVYNMRTGQVTSGGEGAGRVHLRIEPKNADPDEAGAAGVDESDAGNDGAETVPASEDEQQDDSQAPDAAEAPAEAG